MSCAPRLEIDLDKIYHNAHTLVQRLSSRGISVTGVTKATLGSTDIANTLLRAGVSSLGDSRIENIESMRHENASARMTLIRSPMISRAAETVKFADTSFNTEIEVIRQLSVEAKKAGRRHHVMLMVELGDLREGIMPDDLIHAVRETCCLPNIVFEGIGTNLACRSGVSPDKKNMATLTELANFIETTTGQALNTVSGGNSANLGWAFSGADTGRINNLRLGEAILLGCEPLNRQPIVGLHTDAITLVAEVIESKLKPSKPSGKIAQTAFGTKPVSIDRGNVLQTILAIGVQDIDPEGLQASDGIKICGASSDHLILESEGPELPIGAEVTFQLNYSALLRAMTSPFVGTFQKGLRLASSLQAGASA
ncbi:MAG: putative amino acid racemase [Gammaproteobacteria bacterium]|jgi:predicted amino acid racemase